MRLHFVKRKKLFALFKSCNFNSNIGGGGQKRNASRALIGKPERKCPKEELDVDAKTVFIYIERNGMNRVWAEFMCVRIWKTGSCCEQVSEFRIL
jgi:hypothetical protein